MMNEFDEVKLLPGNAEGNHTVNELLTNLNELPPGYAINKHFKKPFAEFIFDFLNSFTAFYNLCRG